MTKEKAKRSTWKPKVIIKLRKNVQLLFKMGVNRRMGKLRSEVIHNFFIASGTTGGRRMGLQHMWGYEILLVSLVGKSVEKWPIGRRGLSWCNNIKIGLKYVGCIALTGLNWMGGCCFGRILWTRKWTLKFHERKDSFLATTLSSSVRAVAKKITLVNLLNDYFDAIDEIIAGTIVKRGRRHG